MKASILVSLLFLGLTTCYTLVEGGSSFGGVNHYYLANLPATQRDQVITKIVQGGARVIRTFVGARAYGSEKGNPISTSPDVENPLGSFSLSAVLDKYDDLLFSINKISGGRTKVILSLHNANNLVADASSPTCDVYCQYLHSNGLHLGDFYTNTEMKSRLKERFRQILNVYPSKNWPGYTWSGLSDAILAIDLENEPMVSDPSDPFAGWVCEISTFLKSTVNLKGIAVSSGGLRGADFDDKPPATAGPNWPSDVFDCAALDIISFHGYYRASGTCSTCGADQPWYDLFIQEAWGGVLRAKALKANKLLLVEEWSYMGNPIDATQTGQIWAQGHALNVRGIPWLYWDVMSGADGYCDTDGCKEVSVDGGSNSPWATLSSVMQEAYTSPTEFDWSPYFPVNHNTILLAVPSNAQQLSGANSGCAWGCEGWQCSASSPCSGDLECTGGVCKACSWGCSGWQCSTASPCKDSNECSSGTCRPCSWGCKGWACNSANTPCQGELECVGGTCAACSWGCRGWSCSASTPCKTVNQCTTSVCKPCSWGCPGWTCAKASDCQGDLECASGKCGACSWGCLGWACSASSPCKGENECVGGKCKPCSWGCRGWTCSASSPCKPGYTCKSGVCAV